MDANLPVMNTELQKKIYEMASLVNENIGPGHNEKVYQKALICELVCNGYIIDSERHIPVKYIDSKGNSHVLESERIDIFIHNDTDDGNIILELKAIMKPIGEMERVQVKKYFKELSKDQIKVNYGIIINFPQPSAKETREKIDYLVINNSSF